jgi:acyl-CoA reductase-like NAD-dependent aldehyde dehydrogenase
MATKSLDFPFGHNDALYIGGEWIRPSSNAQIQVICPATEELYVSVAEAQEEDINRAVAAARQAFDHGPWPRMSHAERGKYLSAIARKLDERAADIAQVWPNEMGIIHTALPSRSASIRRAAAKSDFWSGSRWALSAQSFPGTARSSSWPGSLRQRFLPGVQ